MTERVAELEDTAVAAELEAIVAAALPQLSVFALGPDAPRRQSGQRQPVVKPMRRGRLATTAAGAHGGAAFSSTIECGDGG